MGENLDYGSITIEDGGEFIGNWSLLEDKIQLTHPIEVKIHRIQMELSRHQDIPFLKPFRLYKTNLSTKYI